LFGLGVNYVQRYHTHERYVQQLFNANYLVEETEQHFCGNVFSKQLTGIDVPLHSSSLTLNDLLDSLPRPGDLRRFGLQPSLIEQAEVDRLFEHLARCDGLEEVYLNGLKLTLPQCASLGSLTKLRRLKLAESDLPPGGLALLASLTQLEVLELPNTRMALAEWDQFVLPRLRRLDLSRTECTQLELTKAGWGRRCPRLEVLIVEQTPLKSVTLEAGALPELKLLNLLHDAGGHPKINWPSMAAALPRLTTLGVSMKHLGPESIAALAQLRQLRFLNLSTNRLGGEYLNVTTLDAQLVSGQLWQTNRLTVPVKKVEQVEELVKLCPALVFCDKDEEFAKLFSTDPALRGSSGSESWPSQHWRHNHSGGMSGGFF